MPSEKIRKIIEQFRASFQGDEFDLPLSLRQESQDIVFTALLENDANPMPPVTPVLGYDMQGDKDLDVLPQEDMASEVMRAANLPTEMIGAGEAVIPEPPRSPMGPEVPATQPGAPQQAPAAPQRASGASPLDDLMGLM